MLARITVFALAIRARFDAFFAHTQCRTKERLSRIRLVVQHSSIERASGATNGGYLWSWPILNSRENSAFHRSTTDDYKGIVTSASSISILETLSDSVNYHMQTLRLTKRIDTTSAAWGHYRSTSVVLRYIHDILTASYVQYTVRYLHSKQCYTTPYLNDSLTECRKKVLFTDLVC